MNAVKVNKKTFLFVLFVILAIGYVGSFVTYKISNQYFVKQYNKHYYEILDYLGRSIIQQEKASEKLMYSAAQYIKNVDSSKQPLTAEQLKALNLRLGITHSFIIDNTGKFIRSTNEDPSLIPNLYSFCEDYKTLLYRQDSNEVTPIIPPMPEIKPYKFLTIPNGNRFVHVGLRVDFLNDSLKALMDANNYINKIDLYAPDGTNLGSFRRDNFFYERTVDLNIIRTQDGVVSAKNENHFARWVDSPHTNCCQCKKLGGIRDGKYQYLIKAEVSDAPIVASTRNANKALGVMLVLWALLSYFIAKYLSKQKQKDLLSKLAGQVAHDIRSPLVALKNAIKNEDKELGKLAMNQIESIANNVLTEVKQTKVQKKILDIKSIITKAIELKINEYPKQEITFNCPKGVFCEMDETVILRVISNLLNNAIIASHGKPIDINVTSELNDITIRIQDEGTGFSVEKLEDLKLKGKTESLNGHGIGLQFVSEVIKNAKGTVEYTNRTDCRGAVVLLKLPKVVRNKVVLLDDNYLIGRLWKDEAAKAGVDLSYYSKISDLENTLSTFDKNTEFYLDSDLKDNITGEEYAKSIYDRGYRNISMVTGKVQAEFDDVTWVKSISDKEPPFSTGI